MQLSKRTRYGFRLMIELANNYAKGPISLFEISKKQNLSEKYLEQIIIQLKATGPITAVRGPKGGYRLSVHPSKITLKSIYDLLEGSSGIVECVQDPAVCGRSNCCECRNLWVTIEKGIGDTLKSKTLADLTAGDSGKKDSFGKRKSGNARCISGSRGVPRKQEVK